MECRISLSNVILQLGVSDYWQWHPDVMGVYLMRSRYQVLTSNDSQFLDASKNLIRHSQVLLKVSILARRLFQERLPTKNNLLHRNM